MCTYNDCWDSKHLYDTRRDWMQHEQAHRKVFRCPEHPDEAFASLQVYEDHLHSIHNYDNEISEALINHASDSTLGAPDRICPVCSFSARTARSLQNHIALHLERFALFSLPRSRAEGSLDSSEAASDRVAAVDHESREDINDPLVFDDSSQRLSQSLEGDSKDSPNSPRRDSDPGASEANDRENQRSEAVEPEGDASDSNWSPPPLFNDTDQMIGAARNVSKSGRIDTHDKIIDRAVTRLEELQKYPEAEELALRTLRMYESLGQMESHNAQDCARKLGGLYESQGKFTDAEALYATMIGFCENAPGIVDLKTPFWTEKSGIMLWELGEFQQAEKAMERAISGYQNARGLTHPDTLIALDRLGRYLNMREKYEEAERIYRTKMDRWGSDLSPLAKIMDVESLSWVLEKQSRMAEAESLYRDAQISIIGDPDEEQLNLRVTLGKGILLTRQGKFEEATSWYKDALDSRRPQDWSDWKMRRLAIRLSQCFLRLGQFEEAKALSLPLAEKMLEIDVRNDSTAYDLADFGIVLVGLNMREEAAKCFSDAAEGLEKLMEPKSIAFSKEIEKLSSLLLEHAQKESVNASFLIAEARKIQERMLTFKNDLPGSDPESTIRSPMQLQPIFAARIGYLDAWELTPGYPDGEQGSRWKTVTKHQIAKSQPELAQFSRADATKGLSAKRYLDGHGPCGMRRHHIDQLIWARNASELDQLASWELASIRLYQRNVAGTLTTLVSGPNLETILISVVMRKVVRSASSMKMASQLTSRTEHLGRRSSHEDVKTSFGGNIDTSDRPEQAAESISRDLLPASRDLSKPQHSVFSSLILDDDPMDGSRSLRRRKASSKSLDARFEAANKFVEEQEAAEEPPPLEPGKKKEWLVFEDATGRNFTFPFDLCRTWEVSRNTYMSAFPIY